MKRIQLFEFEDLKSFPSWMRTSLTNLIVVLLSWMKIPEAVAPHIAEILSKRKLNKIVDLGSGSGGMMPKVIDEIRKVEQTIECSLILSDLYPNPDFIGEYKSHNYISYEEESVDASQLVMKEDALLTMMNCFHHMPPAKAKSILEEASEKQKSIFIYEMAENKIPLIIWMLLLPLSLLLMIIMVWIMTPFVKKLSLKQLVFTYLIPIIPFFYAWDGQASMPRIYSFSDIDEMLLSVRNENYSWEKGIVYNSQGKAKGTYLLGLPN